MYKWSESYTACRVQLDCPSLTKITTLVGLCFGFSAMMIFLVLNLSQVGSTMQLSTFLIGLLVTPIVCAINGLIQGLLGYPIYLYLSNKMKGQTIKGKVVGLVPKNEVDGAR